MVFDGDQQKIVSVKGPTLAKILKSRLALRDTTNSPDVERTSGREGAIKRRTGKRSNLSKHPLTFGSGISNLANDQDSGTGD